MIGEPPLNSALPTSTAGAVWPKPWGNWFTQVFLALFGWKRTFYGTVNNDFGLIAAQGQATTTATVTGARVGDIVIARAPVAVNGLAVDATVTADDTVTLRVFNYSAGGINPASQTYSILVVQQ